jgi:hypothetical protein
MQHNKKQGRNERHIAFASIAAKAANPASTLGSLDDPGVVAVYLSKLWLRCTIISVTKVSNLCQLWICKGPLVANNAVANNAQRCNAASLPCTRHMPYTHTQ